jgi:hypothetical protein
MKTFNLYWDRKITTWERNKYAIEAETIEQAVEKLIELIEEDPFDEEEGFIESETLYDANEYMAPEDNRGQRTEEILNGDSEIEPALWKNV